MTIRDQKLIKKLFYFERQITVSSIRLHPVIRKFDYFLVPFEIVSSTGTFTFRRIVKDERFISVYPALTEKQLEDLLRDIDIQIEKSYIA